MSAWSLRELLAYLDRVEPALDKLSHFDLLDISPDASYAQIQGAFHHMAQRLHPDLYRTQLSETDHERLTIVYARIAEAYRALRTEHDRKEYLKTAKRDQEEGRGPTGGAEDAAALLNPKAQRLYRRAMSALQSGDKVSAKLNLKMAIAMAPKSAFLRETLAGIDKS
jgi:DnaJ-class molecular chaperone